MKRRWCARPKKPDANGVAPRHGCKFADRCPYVMEMCREQVPPLFQTEPHRAAACFLYRDVPELPAQSLSHLFLGGERLTTDS
jgi:hypothetical protein